MTRTRPRHALVLLLAAISAPVAVAGCYVEESAVVDARAYAYVEPQPITVAVAPPPPRVEVRPAATAGTDLTWCGGYHDWHRGRWVWVPGRWCRPPQRGRVYEPPTVVVAPGGGYRYYPPSWRPADAPPARRPPPVAFDPGTPSRPMPAPPPPVQVDVRPDPRPVTPDIRAPHPRPMPAPPPPVQVDVRPDPRPVTPDIRAPRPRPMPAPPPPVPVDVRPDPRPVTPDITAPTPRPGRPAAMTPMTPGGTVTVPTPTRPGTVRPGTGRPGLPATSRSGTIGTRPDIAATTPGAVPAVTTLTCSVGGARALPAGGAATIRGTGFARGAVVRVGGQVVPVTALTATSLTIQVPSRVGGGAVTVTNPGGASASCGQLRMGGAVGPM